MFWYNSMLVQLYQLLTVELSGAEWSHMMVTCYCLTHTHLQSRLSSVATVVRKGYNKGRGRNVDICQNLKPTKISPDFSLTCSTRCSAAHCVTMQALPSFLSHWWEYVEVEQFEPPASWRHFSLNYWEASVALNCTAASHLPTLRENFQIRHHRHQLQT